MTIGFALTLLTPNDAAFLLAADARYSADGASADTAIKTYSLGTRVGAVGAGNALSCFTAAELVRGIADDHDRRQPRQPINFYSTVRLFAFFLDKIERTNPWRPGCEVVLAGFLTNGTPALARVQTWQWAKTVVDMWAPRQRGSLVAMVGQPGAKEQVAASMSRTFRESGSWVARATATIWYLSRHEGEPTIGGGPSVAVCQRQGQVEWPFVVVDGRTYLRGFDVTETGVKSGPGVIEISYEEDWHSEVDQERPIASVRRDEGFTTISRYVEGWVKPDELFEWKVDPQELCTTPDASLPQAVVVIARPGEFGA